MSLRALGWIFTDEGRARRFLDLTGLSVDQLRARIESAELQLAVLEFLCAHEPDMPAAGVGLT